MYATFLIAENIAGAVDDPMISIFLFRNYFWIELFLSYLINLMYMLVDLVLISQWIINLNSTSHYLVPILYNWK